MKTQQSELAVELASGTCCYLYGITAAADTGQVANARGVLGNPVEPLVEGELAALLSELRAADASAIREELTVADEEATRLRMTPLLEAHARVIDGVFAATTVLPLRFGTLLMSKDQTRELLQEEQQSLAIALSEVSGRAEWDLQISWDPSPLLTEQESANDVRPPTDEPSGGAGGFGRAFLEDRRAERDRRQVLRETRLQLAERLHARLSMCAAASRPHGGSAIASSLPLGRQTVLHAAYLVARDRTSEFELVVEHELDELPAFDLRGRLSGPLPPYSFADLRIGANP